MQQAPVIAAFLRFSRKLIAVCDVVVGEGTTNLLGGQAIRDIAEQAAPNNFESLFGANRLPQRLDTTEVVGEGL
ncbi:hypothetical protein D3C84_1027940 [compost metagenome]